MGAEMRLRTSFFAIVLLLAAASAPTDTTAQSLEDKAALLSLDAAYRAKVDASSLEDDRTRALDLIHKIIERISHSFIEPYAIRELANFAASTLRRQPIETPPADLAYAAIDTLVRRLNDPYATFDERRMRKRGKRTGSIGIEATIVDGQLKVIAPLDGSPAQKAGVEPGDLIVEIDREAVHGATLTEAMRRIRGPLGTDVLLRIQRKGAQKIGLPVPRTRFRVRPVRNGMFGDFAYIRIAFFGPNTEKLLRKALAEIRAEMKGGAPRAYILDLRNNPGGLVGQAVLVADAFLEKGMIVATSGRDNKGSRRFDAYRGDYIKGLPIILLQNQATASAAEIVSAALRDNRRAVIMGTRSYGKGIVQTAYPFGALGRIKFTTHQYMTAAGLQIHEVGVLPDIVVNSDPRPTYGAAAVAINRCPVAGKSEDRMLGCAILFLQNDGRIDRFVNALPKMQ